MSDRPSSKLIRTIEGEIVPRLLVSLGRSSAGGVHRAMEAGTDAEPDRVTEFARLLLDREAAGAAAFVRAVYQRGTSPDRICLKLMAPAARRLGELWEQDECDFESLVAGLTRIESLLGEVGARLL